MSAVQRRRRSFAGLCEVSNVRLDQRPQGGGKGSAFIAIVPQIELNGLPVEFSELMLLFAFSTCGFTTIRHINYSNNNGT